MQDLYDSAQELLKNSDIIPDFTGHGGSGSNSWTISGNLTNSGFPLLANDPHLDSTMPCVWHLSELIYMDD